MLLQATKFKDDFAESFSLLGMQKRITKRNPFFTRIAKMIGDEKTLPSPFFARIIQMKGGEKTLETMHAQPFRYVLLQILLTYIMFTIYVLRP